MQSNNSKKVLAIVIDASPNYKSIQAVTSMKEAGYEVTMYNGAQINFFGGASISTVVFDEENRPAHLEPADEKKLKRLGRQYELAKIRRDRVAMSALEKEIAVLRGI